MSWISRILGKKAEPPATGTGAASADAVSSSSPVPAPAGAGGESEILVRLKAHLVASADDNGKPLGEGGPREDVDLYEAGYLDSLTVSDFLVRAEKEFGLQLPDSLIGGRANTLTGLARYIEGELGSVR